MSDELARLERCFVCHKVKYTDLPLDGKNFNCKECKETWKRIIDMAVERAKKEPIP